MEIDFSNLARLLGLNGSTVSTGTTASTGATTKTTMSFSDEYKTSLEDLEKLRQSGAISWSEYAQLKKELEADKNVKQNVFDSNQDGLITGYESDLYNEYVSTASQGTDINISQTYQQALNEIQQMYSQGMISLQDYQQLRNEAQQEYRANYQKDTNHDGVLSAEEQAVDSFKEKVALYKKMDKDSDGELNENEQAALDAYNEALENPDSTFETKSIKALLQQANCITSEKLALYKQLSQFDIDGDGNLNYAEYQAMSAYLDPPKKTGSAQETAEVSAEVSEEDAELIAKFDIDGDGVLNETEQAALDAYKATLEENELQAKFDIDGNGTLDSAEQAALNAYKSGKEEADLKAKFDIDGNGVLDSTEQAALDAYKAQKSTAASVDGVVSNTDDTAVGSDGLVAGTDNIDIDVSISAETMKNFDYNGDGVYDSSELEAIQAYIQAEQNAKLDAKIDVDADGVVEKSEIAAMRAYIEAEKAKGNNSEFIQKMEARLAELENQGTLSKLTEEPQNLKQTIDTVQPVAVQTDATEEVASEEETEQQSLLASLYEEAASIMQKIKNISLASLINDTVNDDEDEVDSSSSSSSSSSGSSSVKEEDDEPSLFDRMLEYKISQQMHEMIDTEVIEPDEEVAAALAQEGIDVVEEKFDFNGDKVLDDDERAQHDTYIRKQAQKRVDEKFDINGDNVLDDDEKAIRDDYMSKVAEKHAAEGDETPATDSSDDETPVASSDSSGDETPAADSSGDETPAASSDSSGDETPAASSDSSSGDTVKKTLDE